MVTLLRKSLILEQVPDVYVLHNLLLEVLDNSSDKPELIYLNNFQKRSASQGEDIEAHLETICEILDGETPESILDKCDKEGRYHVKTDHGNFTVEVRQVEYYHNGRFWATGVPLQQFFSFAKYVELKKPKKVTIRTVTEPSYS